MRRKPPAGLPASAGILAKYVQAYAREAGVTEGRVRGWISYMVMAGLLERAATAGRPRFIVKGGIALELRLRDRARATKDIDVVLQAAEADLARTLESAITGEAFSRGLDLLSRPCQLRFSGRCSNAVQIEPDSGNQPEFVLVQSLRSAVRMDIDDRIKALQRQAEKASGGKMTTWESDDLPPEVREQFWQRVMAFEHGPFTTHYQQLLAAGIALPEPATLSDEQLSAKLWEAIEALARLRVFLLSTNHLSDRQLYDLLLRETLHDEIPIEADDPATADVDGGCWHLDLVATGSDEDIRAWLTYYADEQTRERWRRDWPDDDMPAHQDPPYDRDRHLP